MSEIAELVRFSVKAGERERFLRDRPVAMAALREAFPGLLDAVLSETDEGTWIDVVRWTSADEAKAAAAACGNIPAVAGWMSTIDQVHEMTHAGVRHRLG